MRAGIFVTFAWMLSGCAGHSHAPQGSVPATWTNTPSFSDFDYARPDRYLTLQPSLGDRVSIERAAAEVRGSAAGRDALDAATAWFDVRVRHDPNHPYVWRSFERVISDGYWMWCADRAVAIGTLLRAMGVPTIWVKSMEVGWIRQFGTGDVTSYRGHVFLEVYVRSKWQLFDPVAMTIYAQYDPRTRLLPRGA
jgi:transglutaminase-like putative cysteine protease